LARCGRVADRLGISGVGLAALDVGLHLGRRNGGAWTLVAEFTEVESGKDNARPQLAAALAACRLHGARLVIAKLDRLSRNAAFLLTLRDGGVRFVAADMPDANEMTIGILAVVAQHEREQISARTKAALAVAKARGRKLGNPANLSNQALGSVRGNATRSGKAKARVIDLAPVVMRLRETGATSLRELADGLNREGIPAARGGGWSATQVARVLSWIAEMGAR